MGDEHAWAEVQDNCETWYEFLAGWLFYSEPTVKSFELGQFAKHSITKMQMKNHLKHLDRVLLAAMEFDMFQVSNKNHIFIAYEPLNYPINFYKKYIEGKNC